MSDRVQANADAATIAISLAESIDAQAILDLQRLAYQSEARLHDDWSLPALTQSLESLLHDFELAVFLKAVAAGKIVGSIRARAVAGTCEIGRLIVHPDCQGKGIGSQLLTTMESRFPDVHRYELFTGNKSAGNIRLYQRHGYSVTRRQSSSPTLSITFLEKLNGAYLR